MDRPLPDARGSGSRRRSDRAGRGASRPGLHGQCGPGLSRSVLSARGSGTACGRGKRPILKPGQRAGVFRSSSFRQGSTSKGPATRCFAVRRFIAGYRFRSDVRSHQWIGERLGVEVLPLELIDPRFYHLDTCFCPLAPDLALYYPGAFDRIRPLGAARPDSASDRGRDRRGHLV